MFMTPWVLRLLIANIAVYFVTQSSPQLANALALVPALAYQRPWTPITYMFVHAGFEHLLFNMIGLFFFGPRVEMRLGGKNFLGLYVASGLAGAALSLIWTPFALIVGASGAIYGILIAFARYWPRERIYLYAVLPVEAWLLVAVYAGLSIFGGFGGFQRGVAHFAHLGGLVGGWLYLMWLERRSSAKQWREKVAVGPRRSLGRLVASDADDLKRWESIPLDQLHELNRREVDRLLAKARTAGVSSLSSDERACLDRFTFQRQ